MPQLKTEENVPDNGGELVVGGISSGENNWVKKSHIPLRLFCPVIRSHRSFCV